MFKTPILILTFKRPEETKKNFKSNFIYKTKNTLCISRWKKK